ncbi:MAG: TerB N-terminal domain-containing protein [Victivallales bacterium]|nr:TerB N-terminal domain-containing protein [Victivallales bacterium]
MELSELTSYAEEKYQIREQHKLAAFPGASVLCHPKTSKWIALLMRQWDGDLGEIVERCDMKCGQDALPMPSVPYISAPFKMQGKAWAGVIFDSRTDKEEILRLFDRAVRSEEQPGTATIVVASQISAPKSACRDTPVRAARQWHLADIPELIYRMLDLYDYGDDSTEQQALNFYRQGKLMEQYEDDAPWNGEFKRYFPTYHDMNIRQLRGYFTWRTRLRKGEWQRTSVSMAYVYIYELLNGIGTASPEESLDKMRDFERNYIDTGLGDRYIGHNLRRWMLEFAVINGIPAEKAIQCADESMARIDNALAVLHSPDGREDREVVDALCHIAEQKSPVPAPVVHLVAETWRHALKHYDFEGMDLFTACFGEMQEYVWHPFSNAVYYNRQSNEDTEYILNECRRFERCNGVWFEHCHERLYFKLSLVCELLHQADFRLRRYLKTGHYLREKSGEEWARPFVNAVIEEDKRRREEAARPKIDIRLESLEHIREDAIKTRESLLAEEDLEDTAPEETTHADEPAKEEAPQSQLPLEQRVLLMLLDGEPTDGFMKANRLMPSVVADAINEAFFDDIGDNIVECDNDRLSLVEDYTEDVRQLMDKIK